MPQISKIRIVNFNYNDGNRFIPDELYDLSSSETGEALNSLFNLNNGGGKTVLVQLMMQPIHPKAMAGGRRIEDYFVRPGDHSFILLEWNLDVSKDKLLIGIAIAASTSNSSEDNQRGNRIKYYTFKTIYEGRSQYGIAEMELSKNENGKYIPAPFDFIREKSRTSKGALEYYSSDDSLKWTEMLSEEYGIHRTEWETVIEVLNKDEGGLNQYFDEARTSDKLISKFFIPAIEHKLMNSAVKGVDNSLETMLINYAKKITDKENVIKERDTNNKLLGELNDISDMIETLYCVNGELTESVSEAYGFKAALSQHIIDIESEIERIGKETEKRKTLISHIEYEEKSKAYYIAKERYDKAKSDLKDVNTLIEKCKAELDDKKHEEDIFQCANLYGQIRDADVKIKEIKKCIEEKENDSENSERIANLKYSVFVKAQADKKNHENEAFELEMQIEKENDAVNKCEALKNTAEKESNNAKEKYNTAESNLLAAQKNTDKRINSLGIELIRKFDGSYSEDDIKSEKIKKLKQKEQLDSDIQEIEKNIERIENRKNEIPNEKADIKVNQNIVSEKLKKADSEMEEYDLLYEKNISISNKYSLNKDSLFSEVLKNVVRKEIETTDVDIATAKNYRQILEEKKNAAEKGYLHILPEIMRYISSTGISCVTGEEYICTLIENGNITNEKAERILSEYPEIAYSLLFNTDKELRSILSAGNIDWLPAVVPLFTMEQVGLIFDNNFKSLTFLSACDNSYFKDRSGYVSQIYDEITRTDENIDHLQEHLDQAKEEQEITNKFNYSESWRAEQEIKILSLKQENDAFSKKLQELDKESKKLHDELSVCKKNLDENNKILRSIDIWLESFAELEGMLSDEINLDNERQNAYIVSKNAENNYKKACDELRKYSDLLASLKSKHKENDEVLKKIQDILSKVDNAKKADIIDDELKTLYSQYNSLLVNINESLEGLRNNLESEQSIKHDAETALNMYECNESEYTIVSYSSEMLQKVKRERRELEEKREEIQSELNEKNSEHGSAAESFKQAIDSLADYDGIPLAKEEIGDSFKARIKVIKEEIKSLNERNYKSEDEKRFLERLSDKVGILLEEFKVDHNIINIDLDRNPDKQWQLISDEMKRLRKNYDENKNNLNEKIRNTTACYRDITLSDMVGRLDSVRTMLEDAELIGDRVFTVSESIDAMIASIEKINSQIETDLREIENDFNDIVNQCFIQGKRMYTDLCMIANSSKTRIYDGKPQTQMVKIDMPEEKEISEEASKISIKSEIEQGADELKELFKNGADDKQIFKRAKIIVGSERLLHRYIRKESITVKVYKIDLNSANSSYKRWEDALTQSSGAEKFVVFFSVVLTLMNYTRASAGAISKNVKSVLILDNPFGKITSAHLLRPMFDIAKHFNVQLICLSDINKSDVISCFDCVIKLVIKIQSLSDFEIMTHEGNEKIEHGYYKIMNRQLSLF